MTSMHRAAAGRGRRPTTSPTRSTPCSPADPWPGRGTEPVGCLLQRPAPAPNRPAVTYAEHIAPIVQRRCVDCHRPAQSGPFALLTYRDVARRADRIGEVVARGDMPPWGADPRHGKFANDPTLTAEEKRLIADWIATGTPEGDPAKGPPPRVFPPDGWRIQPDAVYTMMEPFTVPAEGVLDYQRLRDRSRPGGRPADPGHPDSTR